VTVIDIDTSALSFPLCLIPGHPFPDPTLGDFQPGGSIDLPAGTHHFQQASGILADFTFDVTVDGRIDFDSSFDAFLAGRGTNTLVVKGFRIDLDGTALTHGLLPVIAGAGTFLMPDQVHALTLVPDPQYQLQPTSGVVATFSFGVDRTGAVVVPAEFAGFAAATGNRLTIAGYPIAIDGRALSHDLLPVLVTPHNDFLPRSQVSTITVIPALGYQFQPGSGVVADFSLTVGTDGAIDFPADCDGFLAGRGTQVLVVDGYPVLIDATRAGSTLLAIGNLGLPADSPRFLLAVLVPAPVYQPQTADGVIDRGFSVHRDGSIGVDPSLAGALVVSSIARVQIVRA